jgi:hypothetical protein
VDTVDCRNVVWTVQLPHFTNSVSYFLAPLSWNYGINFACCIVEMATATIEAAAPTALRGAPPELPVPEPLLPRVR